jgi:UDP-N-acetylglucosamine diphosphorylase / glucose-1-phosphate thymidylyltransferase / UDP-N-acetylgalactosamine diphosphorylase / glucosamine-1-phosphate N-acetyltransferase / galactosamine-1-phosphate N-acetyltransferase
MSALRLFLFDDGRARRWAPFTLTRPAGEILHGCLTLRERAERVFGVECEGHVSRRALLGYDEPGAPPTVALEEVGTRGTRVFVSSRSALDLTEVVVPAAGHRITVGGRPAGWVLPDGEALPSEIWLRDPASAPASGPALELPGALIGHPWDLVAANAERIRRDIETLWPDDDEPPGIVRMGMGVVSLGDGADIEPGVYVDTRQGPVRLAEGACVEGPARLTGPLYVGRRTRILGGHVGSSTLGPVCIVRGEVADSVFAGFINKAHDGYIGHALLGRWVNLGAFTTNSDLKNNYRPVSVWTPDGERDTQLLKVGCFLGDHVKTGIGTVLNTGTVIGAGSNVYGGIMPPTVVPPFSWGAGPDLRDHQRDKFLQTAERAMARRDQALTPGVRRILEEAWRATAGRRAEGR